MDQTEIGSFIKAKRKELSLSTHKLADLTGVSQSYITQLENGRKKNRPSPDILEKLAPALKVHYYELMDEAGYFPKDYLPDEELNVLKNIGSKLSDGIDKLNASHGTDHNSVLQLDDWIFGDIAWKGTTLKFSQRKKLQEFLDKLINKEES